VRRSSRCDADAPTPIAKLADGALGVEADRRRWHDDAIQERAGRAGDGLRTRNRAQTTVDLFERDRGRRRDLVIGKAVHRASTTQVVADWDVYFERE
jgi:hypothetical protein